MYSIIVANWGLQPWLWTDNGLDVMARTSGPRYDTAGLCSACRSVWSFSSEHIKLNTYNDDSDSRLQSDSSGGLGVVRPPLIVMVADMVRVMALVPIANVFIGGAIASVLIIVVAIIIAIAFAHVAVKMRRNNSTHCNRTSHSKRNGISNVKRERESNTNGNNNGNRKCNSSGHSYRERHTDPRDHGSKSKNNNTCPRNRELCNRVSRS